jgi:hypothetical protein
MHKNPFAGLSLQEAYDGLISGRFGPRWPEKSLQRGYTAFEGPPLLKRAFSYIAILDADGAFKEGWKGLDYGCGWGRFPSALLSKGAPEQLDACDAWQASLNHIVGLGYRNHIFKVSELLAEGEIPEGKYDFITSFSVFTHLSPRAFANNIPLLLKGLKPGGALYLTVRDREFIDHKYPSRAEEINEALERDGVAFLDSGGDLTGMKVFGDAIVTKEYLEKFGNARYLGLPHPLQHVYAISAAGSAPAAVGRASAAPGSESGDA